MHGALCQALSLRADLGASALAAQLASEQQESRSPRLHIAAIVSVFSVSV